MDAILVRNLVLLVIFSIITYTDFKRREIDHWPIISGLVFIVIFSLLGFNNVNLLESIGGFFLGGICFMILAFWGMGGGDIKLMAMIGFFLGWKLTILAMYLSFLLGAIAGVAVIIIKGKSVKEHIPFGPAIALGSSIIMFYGSHLINSLDVLWFLR